MAGGAMAANAPGASRSILKTGIIRREYLWAFILVTSLFFLWGFAYGLLDVLNKHFQNILGITRTQSTGLQAAYFGIGYFAYSPVAAEILKRKGYKVAIISGLGLYSLGAILFWPVAKFSIGTTNPGAIFAGFVVCTAVIACGLATLEVAANSYVTVMPPHNIAGLRLQFSQSFNGVASFTGPLIASKFFFSGAHADDLSTVQYVYMAVAGLGVVVALAFFFTKLPEVSEEALQAEAEALAHAQGVDSGLDKPFWKQVRPITGFVAQFLYVGAQVTIGSFFLFYTEAVAEIPDSTGSQLLSYGLITFTVCRFIGTALLSVVAAPVLLAFCALGSLIMVICISSIHGTGGVVCLIAVMGFESIMYPVIFVLGTTGLGHHTRRAAGLLVMGVAGGAVLPPIQGAISDIGLVGKVSKASSVQKSFLVCVPCFAYIFAWSVWIWHKDGRRWTPAKENREIEREVEAASGSAYPAAAAGLNYTGEKTGAGGHYEGSIKEDLERVERL